jgi:hypothetical protein
MGPFAPFSFLLWIFVEPSALAALAAAIFCASLERGLAGLESPVGNGEGAGDGEEELGVVSAPLFGLEASRLCSASNANFDFGFAPSVIDGAGASEDGPGDEGLSAATDLLRDKDNRCKAVRGISGDCSCVSRR